VASDNNTISSPDFIEIWYLEKALIYTFKTIIIRMFKTTNLPVPKMTPRGLRYPNNPGEKGSINSLKDFIDFALGIIQSVGDTKYPMDRPEYEDKTLQNVSDDQSEKAKEKLRPIFDAIYKMRDAFRTVENYAEVDKLLLQEWPSLRDDMVDWWKKYVDPNVKFEKTDQDPNLGAEPSRADFYARTGYTRDPEDMSESLLRRYIKSVLT